MESFQFEFLFPPVVGRIENATLVLDSGVFDKELRTEPYTQYNNII